MCHNKCELNFKQDKNIFKIFFIENYIKKYINKNNFQKDVEIFI